MATVTRHTTVLATAAGDVPLAFSRAGEGPRILLLHGWGHSGEVWHGVMGCLSGQYELVAPDWPGFGASPRPPRGRDPILVLTEVLAALAEEAAASGLGAVVGDGLGAVVTLRWASHTTPSCRVVLSGCPASGLPFPLNLLALPGVTIAGLAVARALPARLGDQLIRRLARLTVAKEESVSPAIVSSARAMDAVTGDRLLRSLRRPVPAVCLPSGLPPGSTILRGRRDWIVPREPSMALGRRLGTRYVEFPGEGHAPMVEAPEQYADMVVRILR
jgi:pimeloyl-ACP methyl ester carboxylesterase